MTDTIQTVFVVTALLGLVSLLLPLAERLSIPYAVLLAVVGIAIGGIANLPFASHPGNIISDVVSWLHDFGLSAKSLLYVFLPALLFEAALNVDVRQLSDEVAPVLLLAVIGVIVCTFVVGLALWPISPVGILACVSWARSSRPPIRSRWSGSSMTSARRAACRPWCRARACSTTPRRSRSTRWPSRCWPATGLPARSTGSSPLCASSAVVSRSVYVAGWAVTLFIPTLRASRLAEATLTIAFAYVIFVVCDHYIGVSGVVAVAAAALAVSAGGRRRLAPSNWESLVVTWEQLAFWASSLIFLFAAMQTPELLEKATWADLGLLAALVAAALAARAVTLYGLIPMLSFAGIAKPIDRDHKLVMLWGGMRGAVSLALGARRNREHRAAPEVRQFVGILATGFVLFTLLVTAPTMRPLDAPAQNQQPGSGGSCGQPAGDRAFAFDLSRRKSRPSDASIRSRRRSSPRSPKPMTRHGRDPAGAAVENAELPAELRERAALYVLADREQEFCLDYFESRTVSRRVAASLLAHAARLRDGARSDGVAGYQKAAARILAFNSALRLSRAIHHRIGIARPLARLLGDRFEVQLAARFVLQNVIAFNRDQIEQVFGAGPRAAMAQQLDQRFSAIDRAIAALKLQYPTYARQLEVQSLARLAARAGGGAVPAACAPKSIINQDMYEDLQRKLRPRRRAVEVHPTLDLGLKREDLVGRVAMFAALDAKTRRSVARMLRPRLAVPDEVIVRKGERGDAMYFISSGAVEVRIAPTPVHLGSGDFFGELALLVADRRTADVVALGYCQLLSLAARDLHRLFGTEPALRDQIHAVAQARTAAAET